MTRYLVPVVLAAFALSACDSQDVVAPDSEGTSSEMIATDATSSALASGLPSIPGADALREAAPRHIVRMKPNGAGSLAAEVEAVGGEVVFMHEATGIAVVSGLDARGAETLAGSKSITEVVMDEMFAQTPPVSTSQPAAAFVQSPTDPAGAFFFARQWHMRAIGADKAWEAGKLGSEDVTVAILDTGIDYLYPDLQGLVDLDRSISFVPDDDEYVEAFFPDRHLITDIGIHGTHVAATVVSNGLVGAGVTSRTTLIGVKVCSVATGGCPSSAIIGGILHAVDNGADVINMSLGGFLYKQGSGQTVGFFNTLFNYARQNGVTVVVAAGNNYADLDHYNNTTAIINEVEYTLSPATFKTYCDASNVICVSATGPTAGPLNGPWTDIDAPSTYTNYGRSAISVAAPGGNSGGAVWAGCSTSSLVYPVCQTGSYIVGMSGTSMASPHVAGLAALLVAEGYSPPQIRAVIQQSADDLGQSGTDPYYGKGRINVANALGL